MEARNWPSGGRGGLVGSLVAIVYDDESFVACRCLSLFGAGTEFADGCVRVCMCVVLLLSGVRRRYYVSTGRRTRCDQGLVHPNPGFG